MKPELEGNRLGPIEFQVILGMAKFLMNILQALLGKNKIPLIHIQEGKHMICFERE